MYRIKEILIEKGLRSKDLADRLGKSKQYISNVINETGNVSITMLSDIAKALNVEIWELFASKKEIIGDDGDDNNTITCPVCQSKFELKEK